MTPRGQEYRAMQAAMNILHQVQTVSRQTNLLPSQIIQSMREGRRTLDCTVTRPEYDPFNACQIAPGAHKRFHLPDINLWDAAIRALNLAEPGETDAK